MAKFIYGREGLELETEKQEQVVTSVFSSQASGVDYSVMGDGFSDQLTESAPSMTLSGFIPRFRGFGG